jgi:hypothetical protein
VFANVPYKTVKKAIEYGGINFTLQGRGGKPIIVRKWHHPKCEKATTGRIHVLSMAELADTERALLWKPANCCKQIVENDVDWSLSYLLDRANKALDCWWARGNESEGADMFRCYLASEVGWTGRNFTPASECDLRLKDQAVAICAVLADSAQAQLESEDAGLRQDPATVARFTLLSSSTAIKEAFQYPYAPWSEDFTPITGNKDTYSTPGQVDAVWKDVKKALLEGDTFDEACAKNVNNARWDISLFKVTGLSQLPAATEVALGDFESIQEWAQAVWEPHFLAWREAYVASWVTRWEEASQLASIADTLEVCYNPAFINSDLSALVKLLYPYPVKVDNAGRAHQVLPTEVAETLLLVDVTKTSEVTAVPGLPKAALSELTRMWDRDVRVENRMSDVKSGDHNKLTQTVAALRLTYS